MAKLQRKTQKIFAGSTTSDQITAFGTAKTSSPVYTTDLNTIQTDTYTQGWTPSLMSDLAPYLQDSNALWFLVTSQLAYMFQEGIAEWDANTTYNVGSMVKALDSNNKIVLYESVINDNLGHQTSDSNYWTRAELAYGGLPVGTIYASMCTDEFTPYGSVLCDGTEYSGETFVDLWENYLTAGLLATCTYSEYVQSLSEYGNCAKFAIDNVNKTFKVPTISNGTFIQQGVNNASYNAGLPNINGEVQGVGDPNPICSGAFYGLRRGHTVSNSGDPDYIYGFDASRSNLIYGKSNTVQPKAVECRYFVVISTGDLNKAEMDWSEYIHNIKNKLDINLDNLPDTSKYIIANCAMPDYTAGISLPAGSFTPPTNGYWIGNVTDRSDSGLVLSVGDKTIFYSFYTQYDGSHPWCFPLAKGVTYTIGGSGWSRSVFYPCIGG